VSLRNDRGYTMVYVLMIVVVLGIMVSPMVAIVNTMNGQAGRLATERTAYFAAKSGLNSVEYYLSNINRFLGKTTFTYDEADVFIDAFFRTSGVLSKNVDITVLDQTLPDGSELKDILTLVPINTVNDIPTAFEVKSTGTDTLLGHVDSSTNVQDILSLQVELPGLNNTGFSFPLLNGSKENNGFLFPSSNGPISPANFKSSFQSMLPIHPILISGGIKNPQKHLDGNTGNHVNRNNGTAQSDRAKGHGDLSSAISAFFAQDNHRSGEYVIEVTGAQLNLKSLSLPPSITLVLYVPNHGTLTIGNDRVGKKVSTTNVSFRGMLLIDGNLILKPNASLKVSNVIVSGNVDSENKQHRIKKNRGQHGEVIVDGTIAVGGHFGLDSSETHIFPQLNTYNYLQIMAGEGTTQLQGSDTTSLIWQQSQ